MSHEVIKNQKHKASTTTKQKAGYISSNHSQQIRQILAEQRNSSDTDDDHSRNQINKTGLPDKLKNGIEALSGYSMDDVKVHYNSSKPDELDAYAFAQGAEIHLAPGAEKHLPHEAWHVVQQKQGRAYLSPLTKTKSIHNELELEKEADLMGNIILQGYQSRNIAPLKPINKKSPISSFSVIQKKPKQKTKHDVLEGAEIFTKNTELGGPNIKAIVEFINSTAKVRDEINKKGKGFFGDNNKLLLAAEALQGLSKKTLELGNALVNISNKRKSPRAVLSEPVQNSDKFNPALKKVGGTETLLKIINTLGTLSNTSKLDKYKKDITNSDKGCAWAKDVAKTFKTASEYIPDSVESVKGQGFNTVLMMLKGYLSAPSHYIELFCSILSEYKRNLDSAADLKYKVKLKSGNDTEWAGALTILYLKAGGRDSPKGLSSFMKDTHKKLQKDKKINLWNLSYRLGIDYLVSEIQDTTTLDSSQKILWISFLKNPMNAI